MTPSRSSLLCASCLALLIAAGAQAQTGPGGPGGGPAAGNQARPGPGNGMRMHGRWGSSYTPGWAMMTRQERDEHRRRMAEARTPEECRAVRDEHHKQMEERAKARGMSAMRGPRRDACAGWGRG